MKPINVEPNTNIGFDFESNNKSTFKIRSLKFKFKFKDGHHVRVLKYKKFFAIACTPIWLDQVVIIKKVKNIVRLIYVYTMSLSSYEKELQKSNQINFKDDTLIKKKCGKLCVKWQGYDNSF